MYMAAMVLPSMAQPLAFNPPLLMDSRLSGMMSSGSIFINTPRPVHFLQAPKGIVEGEHPGGQLLHADAVLRAGVVLGEGDVLPVDDVYDDNTARQSRRNLDGIRQTGTDVRLDHQTVHHDFNGVFLFFSS